MPTFVYKAIGPAGQKEDGVIEANDRKHAVKQLFARKFKPVSIKQKDQKVVSRKVDESIDFYKADRSKKTASPGKKRFSFQSKSKTSLAFLRKLLELLTSGMPIGDTIRLLSNRLSDPTQKELANSIWKNLSEGRTLASSLGALPDTFSESTVHLIEAGEASGNLNVIVERVVAYLDEAAELRSKLLASLAYPSTIVTVAFGVVIFLLVFLMPRIRGMLDTLGGEMPWVGKVLIGGSEIAIKFGPFVLVAIIITSVSIIQWRRKPRGREVTDGWLLRIPFIGRIVLYTDIFRTSSLMATLMNSGVNTTETFRLVERTIDNTHLKAKFSLCRQHVQEGVSLSGAFNRVHYLPELAIDILTVGENTGNITNSLNEINKIYKRELSSSLTFLTNVISTLALVTAFVLVTLIALSVLLAVFSVSKSLSL